MYESVAQDKDLRLTRFFKCSAFVTKGVITEETRAARDGEPGLTLSSLACSMAYQLCLSAIFWTVFLQDKVSGGRQCVYIQTDSCHD